MPLHTYNIITTTVQNNHQLYISLTEVVFPHISITARSKTGVRTFLSLRTQTHHQPESFVHKAHPRHPQTHISAPHYGFCRWIWPAPPDQTRIRQQGAPCGSKSPFSGVTSSSNSIDTGSEIHRSQVCRRDRKTRLHARVSEPPVLARHHETWHRVLHKLVPGSFDAGFYCLKSMLCKFASDPTAGAIKSPLGQWLKGLLISSSQVLNLSCRRRAGNKMLGHANLLRFCNILQSHATGYGFGPSMSAIKRIF